MRERRLPIPSWSAAALALLASALLAGCAPAATAVPIPPSSPTAVRELAPLVLSSPTAEPQQPAPAETVTSTSAPFLLDLTPAPTETALSTLEVPSEAPLAPAFQAWDGLPTYLADSTPGYYFRVSYAPDVWALTTDNFGLPALVHRTLTNCQVSPAAGRGLPPNATAQQDVRKIGRITYQVSAVSVNGVLQSVTYTGGDGRILTAFQVTVDQNPEQCIQDAEAVLGTLTSVPISQATPIATP